MSLPSVGQSLLANQILLRYLNWRLRYNYFRFRNTNDIDHFSVIGVSFCIWLPNFVQIGAPTVEIWRHIYFSKWRPRPLNTTSGFVFVNVAAFRSSKSISKPNFVQISQLAAEIWLFSVSKYKCPPYWNSTSGFDLDQFAVIYMLFCIRLSNFV